MTKKKPENKKGNNSCKIRSNATKVKLDLYDIKFIYQILGQYHKRQERKDRKTIIAKGDTTQVKVC